MHIIVLEVGEINLNLGKVKSDFITQFLQSFAEMICLVKKPEIRDSIHNHYEEPVGWAVTCSFLDQEVWGSNQMWCRQQLATTVTFFQKMCCLGAMMQRWPSKLGVSLTMSRRFIFGSSAIHVWVRVRSLWSELFLRSSRNPNECTHERSKSARTLIYVSCRDFKTKLTAYT